MTTESYREDVVHAPSPVRPPLLAALALSAAAAALLGLDAVTVSKDPACEPLQYQP